MHFDFRIAAGELTVCRPRDDPADATASSPVPWSFRRRGMPRGRRGARPLAMVRRTRRVHISSHLFLGYQLASRNQSMAHNLPRQQYDLSVLECQLGCGEQDEMAGFYQKLIFMREIQISKFSL